MCSLIVIIIAVGERILKEERPHHSGGRVYWENLMWHSTGYAAGHSGTLVNSMRGNTNVRATGNVAWQCAGKA